MRNKESLLIMFEICLSIVVRTFRAIPVPPASPSGLVRTWHLRNRDENADCYRGLSSGFSSSLLDACCTGSVRRASPRLRGRGGWLAPASGDRGLVGVPKD